MDTTITTYTLELSPIDNHNQESGVSFPPLMVIKFIIGCLGLLGNCFVCLVYLHPGTRKNQTILLITHQAFIDACSSLLFVFYSVYDVIDVWTFDIAVLDAIFCFVIESRILIFVPLALSTYNLLLISLERYFATVHPVRYPRIFSRKYLRVMMATVWLIAPVPQYLIQWESRRFQTGDCVVEWSLRTSGIILFIWEYFIPVSIMSFSFICIVNKIYKSKNLISRPTDAKTAVTSVCGKTETSTNNPDRTCPVRDPSGSKLGVNCSSVDISTTTSMTSLSASSVSVQNTPCRKQTAGIENKRSTSWRAEVTKTLIVVYVVYVVCWTPNQCSFLLLAISGSLDYHMPFYQTTIILAFFSSCVNPFIYALRHKTYKDNISALFARCKSFTRRTN